MLGRRHERGDTIIEVMFAFVLFSMVIVGAFMIMNQGMALAQRSLEVTQVRQQIDSQVLLIRTAQQAVNQQLWETIKGKVGTTTPITLSELAEPPFARHTAGARRILCCTAGRCSHGQAGHPPLRADQCQLPARAHDLQQGRLWQRSAGAGALRPDRQGGGRQRQPRLRCVCLCLLAHRGE